MLYEQRDFSRVLHFIGRHRGGGFGRHGGRGFMGEDGGMPRSRRLGAADLQLAILALLETAPAHGYELIRLFGERSNGFYTPSPGMVYPALTYLDEIGHVALTSEGPRKQYALTDAGSAHLVANREAAEAILSALARIGGRMEEVREAFAGVGDADPAGSDILHAARHALKRALLSRRGCSADQARRIAAILAHATAEILKA